MSELALVASLVALVMAWRTRRRLEGRLATLEAMLARHPGAEGAGAQPVPAEAAPTPPDPDAEAGPAPRRPPGRPPGWGPARPVGPGAAGRQATWLRENWIYPVAGAALVLSGLFLVQYAVDQGWLKPGARVGMALALGAALVIGAEALRRRQPAAGTVLPATLAGAGLVIAMAAVMAALHLYALVGPGAALIALGLLGFLAVALGWRHGPMLAALGMVAGSAAPFALGGAGSPPPAIMGYFAALALAGMAIDGLRRWGWVTWLALAGPMGGAVLMRLAGGDQVALALALGIIAAAAMALPSGRLVPLVAGAGVLARVPAAGVRASFVASATLAGAAAVLMPGWEGPLALLLLAGLVAVWARKAPALSGQMVLPVLALPVWIVGQALDYGPVLLAYAASRLPETGPPLEPSFLVALATAAGIVLMWRGQAEPPGRLAPWTLAGLIMPFGAVAALETTWQPAQALGVPLWAAHPMALAGLATGLALRNGAPRARARLGAAAAMAFALIALALMLVLGKGALTAALAVLMVAAAAMDRRFRIPELGVFQIGAGMALTWRLVVDPGLGWHLHDAGAPEALLAVAMTLAAPLATLTLTRDLPDARFRRWTRLVVETGLVASAVVAVAVLVARLLPEGLGTHGFVGVQAAALISLSWVQVRRMEMPFGLWLRKALAWALGALAALGLAVSLTVASPLMNDFLGGRVGGWPILNSLIPGYLLPGVTLVWLAGWRSLRWAGWGLIAVWAGMAIRHLWQGGGMGLGRGVAEGELYAYTFALITAGAVLVARAVLSGRADLRRIGLALVGAAAAKAFLIDAAGLGGLMRAGAFLALGLSLAALAWVNGWAVAREGARGAGAVDPPIAPRVR
jgi:uncharacterized membrane protein